MKKSFVIISLIMAIVLPFACKKKDTSTTATTTASTTGGTTTGGTTTGTTTTGGTLANGYTITAGTTTTVFPLTTGFATTSFTSTTNVSGRGYLAGAYPYDIQTIVPSTSLLNTGTYSITNVLNGYTGNIGSITSDIYSGINGLPNSVYWASGGTFTASIVNGKQRIQFNNVLFAPLGTGTYVTTYTALVSCDYTQP
jgi:hypothetical protein